MTEAPRDATSPGPADTTRNPRADFANDRDRHLFAPGAKRILALDGGGVRGAITVAFLERIESLLDKHYGKPVRLGDHFDLIGGTSTGAVIAGALALGYRTAQVKEFYRNLASQVFVRQFWRRLLFLRAKFDARLLRAQIEAIVRDRTLESEDLITGFALIAKRLDTGSPWIISNDPEAPFWVDGIDSHGKPYIGNRHYPLVNLVRASTAAPHFFDPELLAISRNEVLPNEIARPMGLWWPVRAAATLLRYIGLKRSVKIDAALYGLFVDGAVTPHNNPALALFQIATLKPFNICWPATPERLSVVSIGTGTYRPRVDYESLGFARTPKIAYQALLSLIKDSEMLVLALMQWMGECSEPWQTSAEIKNAADDMPTGGKMFRFLRYDVRLEQDWLSHELEREVRMEDIKRYRRMDDPDIIDELYEIGCRIAKKQVKCQDWLADDARRSQDECL